MPDPVTPPDDHLFEIGAGAVGGPDERDRLLDWADTNMAHGDAAAFNARLANPGTAAAAMQDLKRVVDAADTIRAQSGTNTQSGHSTYLGSIGQADQSRTHDTNSTPDPGLIRRQTGQHGSIVGAQPRFAAEPAPAPQPTGNGFRTGREMLKAMDAADQQLGDWKQDQQLVQRIQQTPQHIRTSTG